MKVRLLKYLLQKFYGIKFLPVIKYQDTVNTWDRDVIVKTEVFKYSAHCVILTHVSGHQQEIIHILN